MSEILKREMTTTKPIYSDNELLQLIKEGDKIGLELLFKKYYTALCRFSQLILKDEITSEDVVQEFFIKFWEQRNTLQVQQVKSYLYRSVKNASLNLLDTSSRTQLLSDTQDFNSHDSYNSDTSIVVGELKESIDIAVNSLPPQCKLIFKLSRQEEMSYKEIAEHLDISVKTVENQMGKALQILRLRLKPYLNDATVSILIGSYLLN